MQEKWRYLLSGRVRHAVDMRDGRALCGVWPFAAAPDHVWYGSGSQEEYDNVAAMPACRHCVRAGAPDE